MSLTIKNVLRSVGGTVRTVDHAQVRQIDTKSFALEYHRQRAHADPQYKESLRELKKAWGDLKQEAFGPQKLYRPTDPRPRKAFLELTELEELSPNHFADKCQILAVRLELFKRLSAQQKMNEETRERLLKSTHVELLDWLVYDEMSFDELDTIRKHAKSHPLPMVQIPAGMERVVSQLPPAMDEPLRVPPVSPAAIDRISKSELPPIAQASAEQIGDGDVPLRFQKSPFYHAVTITNDLFKYGARGVRHHAPTAVRDVPLQLSDVQIQAADQIRGTAKTGEERRWRGARLALEKITSQRIEPAPQKESILAKLGYPELIKKEFEGKHGVLEVCSEPSRSIFRVRWQPKLTDVQLKEWASSPAAPVIDFSIHSSLANLPEWSFLQSTLARTIDLKSQRHPLLSGFQNFMTSFCQISRLRGWSITGEGFVLPLGETALIADVAFEAASDVILKIPDSGIRVRNVSIRSSTILFEGVEATALIARPKLGIVLGKPETMGDPDPVLTIRDFMGLAEERIR